MHFSSTSNPFNLAQVCSIQFWLVTRDSGNNPLKKVGSDKHPTPSWVHYIDTPLKSNMTNWKITMFLFGECSGQGPKCTGEGLPAKRTRSLCIRWFFLENVLDFTATSPIQRLLFFKKRTRTRNAKKHQNRKHTQVAKNSWDSTSGTIF